jgi:hypothetical protein
MDQRETLLAEIEAFLAGSGMARTTFGRMAVNDGKFVERLAGGGNITIRTMERVRAFIAARPSSEAA